MDKTSEEKSETRESCIGEDVSNLQTPYNRPVFEDQELDFGFGRTFMTPNFYEDALLLLSRTPNYGITPDQNESKVTEEEDDGDIFFLNDIANKKEVS